MNITGAATVNITLKGENKLRVHQDNNITSAVYIADGARLHFYDDALNPGGKLTVHGSSNYYGGGPAVSGDSLHIHGGNISLIGGNAIVGSLGESFKGKSLEITGGTVNFYAGLISSVSRGGISVSESLNIAEGAELNLPEFSNVEIGGNATFENKGKVTIGDEATLSNRGILFNAGTIENNGTINNTGAIHNYGSLTGSPVKGNEVLEGVVAVSGVDGTVPEPGKDYTLSLDSNVLTILTDKKMAITSNSQNVNYITITIASGINANLVLKDLKIDLNSKANKAAFMIADNSTGNVNITLQGENSLVSGANMAGLHKIGDRGSLTISGSGSLTAVGGNGGAGIGAGINDTTGNIFISGGNVRAIGGDNAPGIGASTLNNMTISGGTITANTGNGALTDIGGTLETENLVITGGSVKAYYLATAPKDNKGNYLMLFETDELTAPVYINGVNYKICGSHIDDKCLYFFLPIKDHYVSFGTNLGLTGKIEWIENEESFKLTIIAPPAPASSETQSQIQSSSRSVRKSSSKSDDFSSSLSQSSVGQSGTISTASSDSRISSDTAAETQGSGGISVFMWLLLLIIIAIIILIIIMIKKRKDTREN